MKQTKQKLALALVFSALLLTGCSSYGDVETLLRAPQLSGESSALQKALNSYLGGSATLKYPASGDFLSPFAYATNSRAKGALAALVSGLAEPAGALVALFLFRSLFTPGFLTGTMVLVAGIMIWVALAQLLPTAFVPAHRLPGILGAAAGCLLMLLGIAALP